MSRFLTLKVDDECARVMGQPGSVVGEFGDPADALRFLSAVANSTNNPDERADQPERRPLRVLDQAVGGRWYVVTALADTPNACDAIFTERDDADLFVAFMRPDADG